MGLVQRISCTSVDDYLEGEKAANVRHEYVAGAVYAMAGANVLHNLLTLSLATAFRAHLRASPCHVFVSDMKVRVDDAFYYPDLVVVCGPVDPRAYYQTAPKLIVEVLSDSTEARDRLEKRLAYQKIESLEEYVLASADRMKIEVFRREEAGWQIETFADGDLVRFASVGLELPIEQIYEDLLRTTSHSP